MVSSEPVPLSEEEVKTIIRSDKGRVLRGRSPKFSYERGESIRVIVWDRFLNFNGRGWK